MFTAPTVTANPKLTWPTDPFQPANPEPTQVRPDHPRIIAPSYKWQVLPQFVAQDPYLSEWNDTIMGNATAYFNSPPVTYAVDGGLTLSGILDCSRQVKERIKAWGYAYQMTNDTKWSDRAWLEMQVKPTKSLSYLYQPKLTCFRRQWLGIQVPHGVLHRIVGTLNIFSM